MHARVSNLRHRLLLLALLALTATRCSSTEAPQRPNVAVFLIDTLRPEYLGFHGYRKEMAPFLASLARDSVVFERAFSTSSWTAPATASLFTSMYPHQHGVVEGFFMHRWRADPNADKETVRLNRLPADLPTLPEVFKSSGYATFGLASNINIGRDMGFSRGFDQFVRDRSATAHDFLERLNDWKAQIKQAHPFFLYLHFNDVHEPYQKRSPYYEKNKGPLKDLRARYLSEIGYTDEHIRKIYEALDLGKDTILVVLSDHGEEFRDHGSLGHGPQLYNELTRVLMVFHAPFLGWESQRIAANVSLIDVLPTLVELVGGKRLNRIEGLSLVPLLTKGHGREVLSEQLGDRTLFAHRIGGKDRQDQYWAAIRRHWKLIEQPNSTIELYDHRTDRKEKKNLYSPDPSDPSSVLLGELQAFKDRGVREKTETVNVEIDEDLQETLRSLGYVN